VYERCDAADQDRQHLETAAVKGTQELLRQGNEIGTGPGERLIWVVLNSAF
jgi:hypothetical protein